MRKASQNTTLIVVLAILLLSGILYVSLRNAPQQWSWYPGFQHDSEQPYGASVLYTLLSGFCSGEVTLISSPLEELTLDDYQGNYLALGRAYSWSLEGLDSLSAWVAKGNMAMIATETMPDSLFRGGHYAQLNPDWWYNRESLDLRLNFEEPPFATPESHKLSFRVKDRDMLYDWTVLELDSLQILWPPAEALGGEGEGGYNLIRVPYGKGSFYLFSTPLALTNFYLVQPDGRDYAERVLSHLIPGDVLWDTGARMSRSPHQATESPLVFILQQDSLRYAWYILLLIAVLYLIFRTRRRQASIPLLDPKANHSIDYLDSVAQLYYQQRTDHRAIAEMMREHFMSFLRERFHFRQATTNVETAERLSKLTGAEPSEVNTLFNSLREVDANGEFTGYSLLRLHRQLREFYEKCI